MMGGRVASFLTFSSFRSLLGRQNGGAVSLVPVRRGEAESESLRQPRCKRWHWLHSPGLAGAALPAESRACYTPPPPLSLLATTSLAAAPAAPPKRRAEKRLESHQTKGPCPAAPPPRSPTFALPPPQRSYLNGRLKNPLRSPRGIRESRPPAIFSSHVPPRSVGPGGAFALGGLRFAPELPAEV